MACKIGGEIMGVERKKYCVNGEWKESKTTKWISVIFYKQESISSAYIMSFSFEIFVVKIYLLYSANR